MRGAIHRAGFPLESYSGQQMLEVISGLPREELFSATEERLHETAVGVLAVADRRAVRLFLRPDPFRRFLSCLVYLPRDQYTTSSRLAMSDLLQRRLGGSSVEYTARVSESRLALVHFTVQTSADAVGYAGVDVAGLQDELTEAVRTWDDRLLSEPGGTALASAARGRAGGLQGHHTARRGRWRTSPASSRWPVPVDFAVRLCPAEGPADRRFTLYLASTPGHAHRRAPAAAAARARRPRRAALRVRPRRRPARARLRLQHPARRRHPHSPRRAARGGHRAGVLRGVRGGVARRRRDPTGSPRSSCARACRGARWRCCAPTPATPARSARCTGRSTSPTRSSPTPTSPAG